MVKGKNFLKKKLGNNKGFTLVEMMTALIILLMAASIVAEGVPLAKRAYEKVMDSANAQVLLSTTMTVLRDDVGTGSEISVSNSDKRISFKNYRKGDVSINSGNVAYDVNIPESLYEKQGLEVLYDSVSCSGKVVTFDNLRVEKSGYSEPLAKTNSFKIRLINR